MNIKNGGSYFLKSLVCNLESLSTCAQSILFVHEGKTLVFLTDDSVFDLIPVKEEIDPEKISANYVFYKKEYAGYVFYICKVREIYGKKIFSEWEKQLANK